ncbi:rab3 GTPase-activating protein non-catalytic subunit [Coccinella septempunctata]|uniref:rab3 GTPase-activating protein non-catalytic subunit n=1 Tax=Coccinella septempunctata TaxID=41139 RepID=UPI001D0640CB|nr:rab3 GTPase-activating protein non-catalytic subunit [Coccinella septempunctata]
MSCQINLLGNIPDIDEIRNFLFHDDEKDTGTESWLQKCLLSVSPSGDIIVFCKGRKLVIVTSKWDSSSSSSIFQITHSGTIHEVDNITSVLCLPIVGQSKSSNILPDWTCILVGFESGYVRAYLETCELIYEEQFHNEHIVSIKCRSQHSPRSDIALIVRPEEVYVQYKTVVCFIAGKQFIPILRTNRAQLARAQANSELFDYDQPIMEVKKWEFQDQAIIKDIAVVGLSISNPYDNLLAASTCGGFETKFSSVPPNHTLVMAVGSKPFLGFHFATEGTNQAILIDVAKIVANKLKSALPTWLTGSGQAEKHPSTVQHPAEPMGCRFGLCDLQRSANSIILTSDHKLAAISDSLGRVIIIDTEKGIALKILKGYRDAQCSFVQVEDDRYSGSNKGNRKIALFLVIYSPKKGTLEIFTTQQFLKIATFSASKHSRLVYINYSLMGFTQLTKSKYACQFTTLLIDNDGKMKEIMIPFHFSLNDESSKKARDIHLYKRLREMIQSEKPVNKCLKSETLNTIKEMDTMEMKIQLIELLLKSKNLPIDILLESAIYILDNLGEENCNEPENSFKIKVKNIVSFLNFYIYMKSDEDEHADNCPILKFGEKEITYLKDLFNNIVPQEQHLRVNFADDNSLSIIESLTIFNLTVDSKINLMAKYDENTVYILCKDLFSKHNEKCKNLERFREEVMKSNLNTKDIFQLLIMYWVNRPLDDFSNLENEVNNLTNILYHLLKIAVDTSPRKISLRYYWEDIREIIFNSTKPFPALTAAVSCKYIAYKIEREYDSGRSDIALDDSDLEIWSKENVEWTMLIGKLEDVSLLNLLIVKKPVITKYCTLPKLSHELDISLKFVLQRKGSVSELVSRWLTMTGIEPELIVLNDTLRDKLSKVPDSKEEDLDMLCPKEKRDFLETETLFKDFNTIKVHWPYSLDSGMILANMCWEYALEWKKDIQNLHYLEACISCLKAMPNFFVKLGLFNLVWKTHMNLLFENTIKLINKVGKVPKLRLCIQDTGLSDVQIPVFLKICTDYLDTFTNIVQEMYNVPKTPLKFEPLWENGGQPLVELAIYQTNINYELLLAHYELSLVFHMLCRFGVKALKPMQNLFDVEVINVFFHHFQERPHVDFSRTDSGMTTARLQFLKKMISSSVESITTKDGEVYFREHSDWMSKFKLLGSIWKLKLDVLRIHENVQLFVHGYDTIAHDMMCVIEDKHTLGRHLLIIAGKRMYKYMGKSPNIGTVHTYLTPAITGWIQDLNKDWVAESSLRDMYRLTRMAVANLDEDKYEHKLASILFEAIEQLMAQFDD